ncbi:MAG: hypothetical protein AAGD13_00565 [Pseudomonadota bacterium]
MTFQERPITFLLPALSGADVEPGEHLEFLEALEAERIPSLNDLQNSPNWSAGIPARMQRIRVLGDQVEGDGPPLYLVRVDAEPADIYKARSQDRELPNNGGVHAGNGGWWAFEGGPVTVTAGTFAAALAMSLPWYVGQVKTSFHHSIAYGGGATYEVVDAEPDRVPLAKGQTANGRWLALKVEGGARYMSAYGLEGRGSLNNDSDAWQQSIDDSIYFLPDDGVASPASVIIDRPRPYLTRPHFNGYGNSQFNGCRVIANFAARRGDSRNAGVHVEQPAGPEFGLTINGARGSSYEHFDFTGGLYASIYNLIETTHDIENGRGPVDIAEFHALGQAGQFGAHFLFGVDCYVGSASAIGTGEEYPRPITEAEAATQRAANVSPDAPLGWSNAVEPDYLTEAIVYYAGTDLNPSAGSFPSSEFGFRGLRGRGGQGSIVIQPGGGQANADFMDCRDCSFEYVTLGLGIFGGQSRNMRVDRFQLNRAHTAMSNRMFGAGNGRFGGTITDFSAGRFIAEFFDFSSSAVLGSPVFVTPYCERLERLGFIGGGSAADGQMGLVIGGTFTFRHSLTRGVPATVLDGTARGDFIFEGTRFAFAHGFSVKAPGAFFRNCTSSNGTRQAAGVAEPIEAFFNNGCASMSFPLGFSGRQSQFIRFAQFELPDDGIGASAIQAAELPDERHAGSGRDRCLPGHAGQFRRQGAAQMGAIEYARHAHSERTMSSINSITVTNRQVVIELTSLTDGAAFVGGYLPGDQIREDETGTLMMICDRVGATITARLETNFEDDGAGGFRMPEPFPAAPKFQFTSSRLYAPAAVIWGRRRPGDANIYDCRSENSNATSGATPELDELRVGDYVIALDGGFVTLDSLDGRIDGINTADQIIDTANFRAGYPPPTSTATALQAFEDAVEAMTDELELVPEIAAVGDAVTALQAVAPAMRAALDTVIQDQGDRIPLRLFMRAPPPGNAALALA